MTIKKMNSIILVITMVLGLSLSGCSKKEELKDVELKTISTKELEAKLADDSWVIVDTRINDAYNGWKLDGVSRGGHISGAVDLSANWLNVDNKNKEEILDEALKTKGIDKDKNIVLYDSNEKDAKQQI